jgi:hypothetical protein
MMFSVAPSFTLQLCPSMLKRNFASAPIVIYRLSASQGCGVHVSGTMCAGTYKSVSSSFGCLLAGLGHRLHFNRRALRVVPFCFIGSPTG